MWEVQLTPAQLLSHQHCAASTSYLYHVMQTASLGLRLYTADVTLFTML